MQKDLGDIVYEKKITKNMFVNTYGSDIMTTILVVVNKKKIEQFKSTYMNVLLDFYQSDFEGWQKRTLAILQQTAASDGMSKEEADKLVEEEFAVKKAAHQKMMSQPGVVPQSEKYLDSEDPDGNQLWRVTCMKEQAVDYIKCMKKNGFLSQEFEYDHVQYMENQKLQSQL